MIVFLTAVLLSRAKSQCTHRFQLNNLTIAGQHLFTALCRYAGMVAWRGVCDGNAHPELLAELKGDFETLGNGIIFDIADRCMNLIYMIPGNRINWLW